jgi:transcriptional regulator with XRE-family HTH domain
MTDEPRDALQRLIAERMIELGLSYRDVAERGGLPRSTVHHLATHGGSVGLPRPATLERLAMGLGLPLVLVRTTAAAAAGLFVETGPGNDPETEVLIASLARLSPADRRHVAALVRSLLDDEARTGEVPTERP